jgi:FkbM family methyltransferase
MVQTRMDNTQKIYSQNQEQIIIVNELQRLGISKGRLLEIGAYDPCAFSNSRALIETGWSAVLVEPSPKPFTQLVEGYKNNPNVILVNAAVAASQSKLVEWFDSGGDAISTTNPAHKAKWEAGWKVTYTAFWVYTLPMTMLFDKFGFDFDFINIDVESTNLELFRSLPWTVLKQTKIICVEHDFHQHEMSKLAAEHGFHPLAMNGENLILTRQLA